MDIAVLVLLGIVIGLVLGGLGGGGAILTVPALVYIVGQSGLEATTSSLVIVGLTALTGMLGHFRAGNVAWGVALGFGVAGVPANWLGSRLGHVVQEDVLLLGFAVVIVAVAVAMLRNPVRRTAPHHASRPRDVVAVRTAASGIDTISRPDTEAPSTVTHSARTIVLAGLAVGFLTGFFGVGGGFIIVPALVLLVRLPMQLSVGTSLVIISINSVVALASRGLGTAYDWHVIIPFSIAAMIAALAGRHVADRLPADRLRTVFAGLLLLVAVYTGWQSVAGLLSDNSPAGATASSTVSVGAGAEVGP